MKKAKKYLVLAFAMGLLVSGMTVYAKPSSPYQQYGTYEINDGRKNPVYTVYAGDEDPRKKENHGFESNDAWIGSNKYIKEEGDEGYWFVAYYIYERNKWVEYTDFPRIWNNPIEYDYPTYGSGDTSSSSSSGSSSSDSSESSGNASKKLSAEEKAEEEAKAAEERAILVQASIESVKLESEAASEGFENAAQMQQAQAQDKTAGEYYNNAAVTAAGIENATPVAQGGGLIIDGKVTNVVASINKVSSAYVDSVRAVQDGTVLNVVDVQFPAKAATVNFYMPGVASDANIVALQYASGAWTAVEVVEVRADHVSLNLDSNGVIAFIAK